MADRDPPGWPDWTLHIISRISILNLFDFTIIIRRREMRKFINYKIVGLSILATVLLVGIGDIAARPPAEKYTVIITSPNGNKSMKVTKHTLGTTETLTYVDGATATGFTNGLTISDGTFSEQIYRITNEAVIVSNPCTWYFHNGQWWRICN